MKNTIRRTISFLGVALMATQLFGANAAADTPKEVDYLLKQISYKASTAARNAEALESFTMVNQRVHYESHSRELTGAKEAINTIGSHFRGLQELRTDALPWQRVLIDRVEPVLVGLAGHATDAIQLLNEDRSKIRSQEYRDTIKNLSDYASHASSLIDVNLDYAQAREKLNRMEGAPGEPIANVTPAKAPASLEQRVHSELLKLPYYGVFDHLAIQINGNEVTLSGHVSWPALKTDAERAVRGVKGVDSVSSVIEVLPLSPNDDRIRMAAYRAIYGHSTLTQYRLDPNPPIRIIVNDGHLVLKGVVGSDFDRTIAHTKANSVPGAFSVTNHLEVGS